MDKPIIEWACRIPVKLYLQQAMGWIWPASPWCKAPDLDQEQKGEANGAIRMNQRRLEVPRRPWPPSKEQQALNPHWDQCRILDSRGKWSEVIWGRGEMGQ